jgi:Holliday junction resolvase-like predicted endonuclease
MRRVFLSYSGERDWRLVQSLKRRLQTENSQFDLLDPADFSADYELASHIGLHIKRASIVIAFLTTPNPNLFYEVGMAVGAGKTVLIVGHELESLPTELRLVPFVSLSGNVEIDTTSILDRLYKLQPEDPRPISHYGTARERLETYASDPDYFDAMPPREIEQLLLEWLEHYGFTVEHAQQPFQYGIDVVLRSHHDSSVIVLEMKKFSRQSRVSIKDVMALFGAATLYKAEKAVLITSSSFTVAALEMAKTSRDPRLFLLTMEDLLQAANPALLLK